MPNTTRLLLSLLLAGAAPAVAAQAPRLTLREAIARADSAAYPNRIARASSAAADARAAGANQAFLPGVRAEVGAVRTSDPLGAFGFLLRQREVTPAAFDPAGLNRPSPRTDVGAAIVGEVPLINLDAWAGRRAARHAADAEAWRVDWATSGVQLDVIASYYGAVLAREKERVILAAESAGQAHVRRAEAALRNGVVTRSDMLLAQVRLGELETQRLAAAADAALARRRLAIVLGTPGAMLEELPLAIPSAGALQAAVSARDSRADLEAIGALVQAADAEAARRQYALVPRLNGFGRYEWHDASTPLTGRPMWTVGVMATWAPFSGGAELAARREAHANAEAARAGSDAVRAQAEMERVAAMRGVEVAVQSLTIAARSVAQAAEAHRIVERKYDGGLATVAELLDAQATDLAVRLAEAKARYDLILALGTMARVQGADLAPLVTALDAATVNPE